MRLSRVLAPSVVLASVILATVILACGAFSTDEDTPATPDAARVDDASSPSDAFDLVDVVDGGESGACPSGSGPPMVRIPSKTGGYCIDTTEVTRGQYQSFLDTLPTKNDALCPGSKSYAPTCPESGSNGPLPVTCVDWCDAHDYCAWAGKRLCGLLPIDAGITSPSGREWETACSRGWSRTYAWGEDVGAGVCNVDASASAPVASFPGCVGGYDGVFDLGGNVQEWGEPCQDGGGGVVYCSASGGWFAAPGGPSRCDTLHGAPAPTRSPAIGFRCCADAR